MTTADRSAALVTMAPVIAEPERLALAGFPASYTGLTREAYMPDLRQFAAWCHQRDVALLTARRADIEGFARDLEARGRARSAVSRRLATIAGLCRYAVEEDLLGHSPAAHVRRPRLDHEPHVTGLDRNEAGALPAVAALGGPAGHALVSLLALNGLRVPQAVGADIEALKPHWPGRPGRTPCATPPSPPRPTPASRSATCKKPPPPPTPAPPCGMTAPGHPWTGTPPTSSPPASPEPPASQP